MYCKFKRAQEFLDCYMGNFMKEEREAAESVLLNLQVICASVLLGCMRARGKPRVVVGHRVWTAGQSGCGRGGWWRGQRHALRRARFDVNEISIRVFLRMRLCWAARTRLAAVEFIV
jgi:hypothetical protein